MAKYQKYAEYKDSGVEWLGEIPKDWDVSKLKYYSSIQGGYAFSSEDFTEDGVQILRIGNVYQNRLALERQPTFVPEAMLEALPDFIVKDGDILMSLTGTLGKRDYGFAVGIKDEGKYLLNQRVAKLNPIDETIDRDFLLNVLWSNSYLNQLYSLPSGTKQANLSNSDVLDILIAVPSSKHHQTQIANFLDHETAQIDTLIEKQQTLIQLLKEKRQAVISHAVTKGLNPDAPMKDSGVGWLGDVPEHWELPKLIHQTSKIGDGLHSTPQYQDGTGYYFVNGNNLVNGQIVVSTTSKEVPEDEYKKHYIYLDKSSVLLSINGTIGNVARYNNEMVILGKSAAYMNCADSLLPEYLMMLLQSSQAHYYFDLEVTGTTIYNLSLNSIRQMRVCIPPKQEQLKIHEFCESQQNKYDTLIEKASTAIRLMQERRTALISAAVTGKIDVRGWQWTEVEL